MSDDYLTREFRAQLTITMDSVLRRAVFEIMKVFENSLHEHQLELVQKGEEIVQLKVKLQRTEIKLRESERGGDRGAEMNTTQMNETQREPENVRNASGQTSGVPEIDFEVPDDWCAPLGCETVTKQDDDDDDDDDDDNDDDNMCPSVRLRPLSIPLCPIQIIKQEVVNHDIDSHKQGKDVRRSRRGSSLNEKHKHTKDRSLPMRDQGTRCPPVRNIPKKCIQDIKQEYTGGIGLRRRVRNLTGKEQENTLKSKREERKMAAAESKSTEQETMENDSEKRYSCKFCEKVFDTEFGRSVHMRSHKTCRGCKKEFPFPSNLGRHKRFCGKLKKILATKAQSTDPPKPQSCDEEKPTVPSQKQVIIKKESKPSSSNNSNSSIQRDESTKKYSCVHCNKRFRIRCRLREHMRVHTGEKPFLCSMCPKKFRINQSLKIHVMRLHKDQLNSSETKGDLAWTKPLEGIEDNREDLISPSKDKQSRAINRNKVQPERNPDIGPSPRWQTMGTRCSDGFMCLLCQKVMRNKYLLIEHFHTHTGERPIQCDRCLAKFSSCGQLCMHKKRCIHPVKAIQCEKCEKKFPSQTRYNKHMSICHRDWPNYCKVCGKGFFTKGRLKNHMERCHK